MRHRTSGKKFGRDRQGRRALLVGLTRSLIHSSRITTTEARAKTLQAFVEKLFTTARRDTLETRRFIQKILQNPNDIKKIVDIAAAALHPSGFTQIAKVSIRRGDAARLAEIRLTTLVSPERMSVQKEKPTKGAKPS